MRKLIFLSTKGILTAGVIMLQSNCHAITYDAAMDFSLNSNPNGVWSYGYSATLGSPMALDDKAVQDSHGLYTWRSAGLDPNGPGFAFNPTASPITITGPTDLMIWNPGQLSMSEGSGGQYCVLRFTAPVTSKYDIQGAFSSVDKYYGAKTDVHLLENGASIFDSVVYGIDSVASFEQTVQLNAGDTVDFAVGLGDYGWGWDTTGLDARIVPVPEPSVMGLFTVGFLLLYRIHPRQTGV
jgi:hypothetical protein